MQHVAMALPAVLAALLRDAPGSAEKVDFAWKHAVGPAIGRATAVRLEGDVLLVDPADERWAREIRRSSAMILTRVQALLGETAVRAIEVRRR
jgi:predicted nucleic acid-binding Zn ribbon protein